MAALAAWAIVVPITRQSASAEAQKTQGESGVDLLVVDPQGAVCAGAQIELTADPNAAALRLKTDQDGKARIQAAPGEYSLKISLPGFLDYKKRLKVNPGITRSQLLCGLAERTIPSLLTRRRFL